MTLFAEPLITAAEVTTYLDGQVRDEDRAGQLAWMATEAVRAHVERTLTRVKDDVVTFTAEQTAVLPERPVEAVTLVTVDGQTDSAYRLTTRNGRIVVTPSLAGQLIAVTYTHGWSKGHPRLDTARSVAIRVAARLARNPLDLGTQSVSAQAGSFQPSTTPRLLHDDEKALLDRAYPNRGAVGTIPTSAP